MQKGVDKNQVHTFEDVHSVLERPHGSTLSLGSRLVATSWQNGQRKLCHHLAMFKPGEDARPCKIMTECSQRSLATFDYLPIGELKGKIWEALSLVM